MILRAITIYPVKGFRGVPVTEAMVERCGLRGDRRWMAVDGFGRFLTQRDLPGMARVMAAPMPGGLRLSADGVSPLDVPVPDPGLSVDVVVWRSTVRAQPAGEAASAWLSEVLGHPCALVHMGDPGVRPVNPAHGLSDDRVSFADGYPLLLTSAASIDDLNARLKSPVPMDRFRPNVVVAGFSAWAEDTWSHVTIGAVGFRVPKSCERCSVTQVDQTTGIRARDREPLRTLATFRRDAEGRVLFGINLLPDGLGRIGLGDAVIGRG